VTAPRRYRCPWARAARSIHVGDVVVQATNLMGDWREYCGVSRASGPQRHRHHTRDEQVRDKLDLGLSTGRDRAEEHQRPVQVWHWRPSSAAPGRCPRQALSLPDKPSTSRPVPEHDRRS
jgi:hypothetical protein